MGKLVIAHKAHCTFWSLCWPTLADCDGCHSKLMPAKSFLGEKKATTCFRFRSWGMFSVAAIKAKRGWCLPNARSCEDGGQVSWQPRGGKLDKLLKSYPHPAYGRFSIKQCQFLAGCEMGKYGLFLGKKGSSLQQHSSDSRMIYRKQ